MSKSSAAETVQQTLCGVITRYGTGLVDEPRRCEAFLRDLCGEHKREINVLITALKERIPADFELNNSVQKLPYGVLRSRLVQRLYDAQAVEPKFGSWAVDVWALALGQITLAEYQALVESPFVQQREYHIAVPSAPSVSPIDELREAIRGALLDDVVTLDEQSDLKALSRRLGIPSKVANRVLAEVVAERKAK